MDDRKVNGTPADDLMTRVRESWAQFVGPLAQLYLAARAGQYVPPIAGIIAQREKDPRVWAEWGRETARRYCLHDNLNVGVAIDLDHRQKLVLYPENEWKEVSRIAQEACLAELLRLWPALYQMRLAMAEGSVYGALHQEVDLADDLSVLPRLGARIAAYVAAGQVPELRCDGRYLIVKVEVKA